MKVGSLHRAGNMRLTWNLYSLDVDVASGVVVGSGSKSRRTLSTRCAVPGANPAENQPDVVNFLTPLHWKSVCLFIPIAWWNCRSTIDCNSDAHFRFVGSSCWFIASVIA